MDHPFATWLPRAPSLRLLPLLALYLLFVLLNAKDVLIGDEGRYVIGARNILQGFLASEESLYLWNGPGYPLYLVPFVALGLPLLWAKLGNAVLLWLALLRVHQSLDLLGPASAREGWGNLAVTYGLGVLLLLHGTGMEVLMTECLSVFFLCGAFWHYLKASRDPVGSRRQTAFAALHLAGLALTKVFFGYAITVGILLAALWWAWSRLCGGAVRQSRLAASVCALALLLCVPYLAYTYKLTDQAFFWSNSGGSQLYCMTLREKELLGDWLNFDAVQAFPEFFTHQAPLYREWAKLDYVTRDQAMKAAAIANLKADPAKYIRNWRANLNRMVFGYPNSRFPGSDPDLATGNRAFVYAAPFFLCLFMLPWAWRRRAAVDPTVHAALAFALVSLGGLSLMSAFPRMVFPLLPLLGIWLGALRLAGGARGEGPEKIQARTSS